MSAECDESELDKAKEPEKLKITGLHLGSKDYGDPNYIHYDIGEIVAWNCLSELVACVNALMNILDNRYQSDDLQAQAEMTLAALANKVDASIGGKK